MAANGSTISPRKQRAVIALLEQPTIIAAAEAAGVGNRTLSRWLAEDEAFRNALRDAQRNALDRTISQLAGSAPLAATVLADIATDEAVPAAVRVQAASRILSELRRNMQLLTLSEDIDHIKEVLRDLESRN